MAVGAAAQLALFGVSPLGLLAPPPHLAGQIAGLGFPPVAVADGTGGTAVHGSGGVRVETPTMAPTFSSAADASSSSPAQDVARAAAIRAQVAMLEAQVASLQAQLSAQSLRDGGGVGVGADAESPAPEKTEGSGEAIGPERDETVEAAAPTEDGMAQAAPVEEEGEIVPAMNTDSEAEAIRRRRLERFGANP